jgi:hypothetical protein
MSKCHIIVGATDTGKSYFLKNKLRKLSNYGALFVYDINNEYTEFIEDTIIDIDEFTEYASKLRNAIIVFEEATIFFDTRGNNKDLKKILVRKKHTHNLIFLLFHSVRSIPRYVYELSNYITIFHTNDSPDMSAKELKDERIETIMKNVNENSDIHYSETLKIY